MASYTSPISRPLLDGKLLERSLKLVRLMINAEKELRVKKKSDSRVYCRLVRRGVAEVTKSIRKGERGIVLLAGDVYPLDIIAHLPILCEEKKIVYGYVGSKAALGGACASGRPASVLMLVLAPKGAEISAKISELYDKVSKGSKKCNPWLI